MARFDRYFLSQLLVLFGFFALVLVLIYWINRAVGLFDQLIADGQSALVFLEFTAMSLPNLIRLVLPTAAFAAVVYVTNRMSGESELTVVQSTGYSPWRLARPVLIFGVIVALMMAILSNVLNPMAADRLAIRTNEIAQTATARLLREGVFTSPSKGTTLYLRDLTDQGELLDVFLSDATSTGQTTVYTADRAFLVKSETGPKLVMIDGMAQTYSPADQRLNTTRFNDFVFDIGALIGTRPAGRRGLRAMSTLEVFAATPALLTEAGRSAGAFANEAHGRITQGLFAISAVLVGFSIMIAGGFSRFGIWRQVLLSIAVLAVLKIIEGATSGAIEGDAGAWPLSYLPFAIGLVITALLLAFAARKRRVPPAAASAEPEGALA